MRHRLAAPLLCWIAGCSPDQRPMSVVLISIDTCRADRLSCYGHPEPSSPNIDAVARDGARFARAQSTNSVTLPAHSSMMTGTIPPVHGVHDNDGLGLLDANTTLAEIFRSAGYRTAAIVGAFPLHAQFGLDQGFELYDDELPGHGDGDTFFNERPGKEVSRAGIAWLREHARDEQPFFLFLHFFDPHAPYAPPEPFASEFAEPYVGEIAYTDDCVGEVMDELKEMGLYEDALVIITADHGESLGEHGEASHAYFAYQSTTHVPLIIKSPTGTPGVVIDDPVGIVDILPTSVSLAGLTVPANLRGVDLSAHLSGAQDGGERFLYSESLVPASYGCAPIHGLVHDRWHYLTSTEPELYDLLEDQGELRNVAGAKPALAGQLDARLRNILEAGRPVASDETRTADPAIEGRFTALGYASGMALAPEDGSPGEDPRAFLPVYLDVMQAEGLFSQGRYDEARAKCRSVLAARPHILRASYLLGRMDIEEGDLEGAIGHLSGMLEFAADDTRLDASTVVAARSHLSHAYLESGRHAEAEVQFRAVLRLRPDQAESRLTLASLLRSRGRSSDARREYEELIRRGLLEADAHYQLGQLWMEAGQPARARAELEAALRCEPEFALAHFSLGVLCDQLGDTRGATEHFEAELRRDADHAPSHFGLGLILARKGQLAEAVIRFERALALDPDFEEARDLLETTRRSAARDQ